MAWFLSEFDRPWQNLQAHIGKTFYPEEAIRLPILEPASPALAIEDSPCDDEKKRLEIECYGS